MRDHDRPSSARPRVVHGEDEAEGDHAQRDRTLIKMAAQPNRDADIDWSPYAVVPSGDSRRASFRRTG
jgi:hypothetical protein